jgi:hypothetical protein
MFNRSAIFPAWGGLEARHNAHCGGKRVSDEQRGVLVEEELANKMLESDGISGASIMAPTNLKLMATLHA